MTQQGMANRQHQGPSDAEFTMGPEGIKDRRDTPFNGILNRNHSSAAISGRQLIHNGAQSFAGNELRI